jgi:two-component system chemotaxis response regulator CheY|nr:MAG: response regulator [Pseudomonadota bacterium]
MGVDLRFLIVDDFSTMRRIMRKFLNDLGYTDITEAEDGATALKILKQGNIDFLVTDWNMPGMPGIELLRQARADPALANLRVLMVTAEDKRQQIVEAIHAGVNGYLVKPFTAEALKERIDQVLASWAAS